MAYARTHVHPDYLHKWNVGDLFIHGLRMLELQAFLRKEPEAVMVWVDSQAKHDCPRVKMRIGGQVTVLRLFSNIEGSYKRRPTQWQVEFIARKLQLQPRWWQAAPM